MNINEPLIVTVKNKYLSSAENSVQQFLRTVQIASKIASIINANDINNSH